MAHSSVAVCVALTALSLIGVGIALVVTDQHAFAAKANGTESSNSSLWATTPPRDERVLTYQLPANATPIVPNQVYRDVAGDGSESIIIFTLMEETTMVLPATDDDDTAATCCDQLTAVPPSDTTFDLTLVWPPSPAEAGTDVLLAIRDDTAAWNKVLGKSYYGKVLHDPSASPAIRRDGINEVGFGDILVPRLDGRILAVTVLHLARDGSRIIEEIDWCYNIDGADYAGGTYEFETVDLHELGHGAGLADLYDQECQGRLMYYALTPGETRTIDYYTQRCFGAVPLNSASLATNFAVVTATLFAMFVVTL